MASAESIQIRKTMVRDRVREGVSIQQERLEWEEYSSTLQLATGTVEREETIAGRSCLWLLDEAEQCRGITLYVHGGGLVAGSPRTHRELASRLAKRLRRELLLVDYCLAPEHPFPAALADIEAVYRELLAGTSNQDIVFGADSTGAALALSSLVKMRDDGRPLPSAAFFISGHFDMTLSGESMDSRREVDPFTSKESLARAIDWYTNGLDPRLPLISPLFADLRGLPSILLQVGADEILLSDSLRLAEALHRCGGSADLKVWENMWHVWPMWAQLPEADAALREIEQFLDNP
jgi:monoterpene epsilon-lactone hydrolase